MRAEGLPFADDSFDAAGCQFAMMFFADRVAALREMARVVRPGGRFTIAVWDALDRNHGFAAFTALLQRLFGDEAAGILRAPFSLGEVDPANNSAPATTQVEPEIFVDGFESGATTALFSVAVTPQAAETMRTRRSGPLGGCKPPAPAMRRRCRGRLALAFALASLAAHASAGEASEVLARVGTSTITADDLMSEIARRGAGDPAAFDTPEERRALLDEFVAMRVRVEAAKQAGYLEDPRIVAALDRLLVRALEEDWAKAKAGSIAVDEAALQAEYDRRRSELALPERREIALLQIAVPYKGDPATARAEAVELRTKALALPAAPAHFGPLAATSADRGTRFVGGAAGWVVAGERYRWPAEVVAEAFALAEPGAVSPVLEAEGAFWLVRLMRVEPAGSRPFEQVRDGIAHDLRRDRERAAREAWDRELAAQVKVEIDDDAVAKLATPVSVPPPVPSD